MKIDGVEGLFSKKKSETSDQLLKIIKFSKGIIFPFKKSFGGKNAFFYS